MDGKVALTNLPRFRDVAEHSRTRRVRCVDVASQPEGVLMHHLNDPNYDLCPPLTPPPPYASVQSLNIVHGDSTPDPSSTSPVVDATTDSLGERRCETSSPSNEYEESPYAEVRAAVPNVDCPWMPVNTFRMWLLGVSYTIIVSGLNQIFTMRYPSVIITGTIVQLTALPLGKVLEWTLPATRFRTFGYSWTLNPGPFSIKEHVVITSMANVIVCGTRATDIVATLRIFYQQPMGFSCQIMLILSTQLVGFSLGGILRQFVVWPASMVWPDALVNSALFTTLHKNYGMTKSGRMSREKFFCIALICSFVWYWIPGYLWTGMSVFNWVCWAAPENVVVNHLFGTRSGLGMSVLTMDWAMISYIGSPLVTPWWSQANTIASFFIFIWIITPILYYTNTWFAKFLPISSHVAFANTGLPYDPTAVLTKWQFDAEKYRVYSPPFLSTTMLMAYGLAFASFTAIIVHSFLWYRSDIVRRFNTSIRDERDIHCRLMQVYPEVPHWWYAIIGIISATVLAVAVKKVSTQLPIWGIILALMLTGFLSIPLAMIQAMTNQRIGFKLISEVLAGYLFEGKPIANMIFKLVSVIGFSQAISFSAGMKLGHYMKIPPRIMFTAQTVAVVISCFVVEVVQEAMLANIVDICTPGQKSGFTCAGMNTFATASLFWGGIGPRRLFSPGAMYSNLLWFFLMGALAPVPFYFLSRRFPYSFWRYVNLPVFFAGVGALPPATAINYSSWAITGFVFNFHIRRRHFRWWIQFNYILSAALDAGVALSMIGVFFTLQFSKGGITLNWWGNTVWQNTADAKGIPFWALNDGETFGPMTWA